MPKYKASVWVYYSRQVEITVEAKNELEAREKAIAKTPNAESLEDLSFDEITVDAIEEIKQ